MSLNYFKAADCSDNKILSRTEIISLGNMQSLVEKGLLSTQVAFRSSRLLATPASIFDAQVHSDQLIAPGKFFVHLFNLQYLVGETIKSWEKESQLGSRIVAALLLRIRVYLLR